MLVIRMCGCRLDPSWVRQWRASQDDGEKRVYREKIAERVNRLFLVRIRQIIALPLDLPPSPKGEGLKEWRDYLKSAALRAWILRR